MSKRGAAGVADRRPGGRGRPKARRAGTGKPRRGRTVQRSRRGWWWAVAFIVLAAAGGIAFQASRSNRGSGTVVHPVHAVGSGGSELLGSSSAPVLVEEYGDFQCPACANWDRVVFPTVQRLAGEGKIRFAYYPFAFLGPESVAAASAAECAGDEGKFWEYRDYLFANQYPENSGALTTDRLIEIGRTVGISSPAFDSCVRAGTYVGWIGQIGDRATSVGVTSTPTIIVNGHVLSTPPSPDQLVAAVDAASP